MISCLAALLKLLLCSFCLLLTALPSCCCFPVLAALLMLQQGSSSTPVWQQLQQLCRRSITCLGAMLEQQTAAVAGEHTAFVR
jgi:hypothetical protein